MGKKHQSLLKQLQPNLQQCIGGKYNDLQSIYT